MSDRPKWTPGQWRVEDDWNVGTDKVTIVSGSVMVKDDAESVANAHLIAAAPDLYAALDGQVRNCPQCKGTGKSVDAFTWLMSAEKEEPEPTDCKWCGPGRAALAKARWQA